MSTYSFISHRMFVAAAGGRRAGVNAGATVRAAPGPSPSPNPPTSSGFRWLAGRAPDAGEVLLADAMASRVQPTAA